MPARVVTPFLCLAAAAVIGCNAGASASASAAGSVSPTLTAAPRAPSAAPPSAATVPSATPSSATPSVFTSKRYGYVVSLLPPWTLSYAATTTWDGVGAASHDGSYVDQFAAPEVVAWAAAAPTKLTLAQYADHVVKASAAEHACPATPDANDPIAVGGEAARLLTLHCPILVLIAVTIVRGSAETFAFQSPFGNSGTEAADRALFTTFLSGISFRS